MKTYRTAIVLGLGASGAAAARLLLSEGTRVTVLDRNAGTELSTLAADLEKDGACVLLGSEAIPSEPFEVCILSPGVPADSEWAKAVKSRHIDILPELELGWSRCRCKLLAITGSNGKSTLVKLLGDVLGMGGMKVELGGNYGTPLSAIAARSSRLDWIVAEVSSFQLETVQSFSPDVGVLLNLNPNHLDRHGNMQAYSAAKARLFTAMRRDCTGIVPGPDLAKMRTLSGGRNKWMTFGIGGAADCTYTEGFVRFLDGGREMSVDVAGTFLANNVMGMSAAAAVAATLSCGLDGTLVEKAAGEYKPLPHRMTGVATVNGVKFIDDSKATNLAALEAGVTMCRGPVRLIAGGLLKETDLGAVKKALANRVRQVYLIGKAAQKMEEVWGDVVACSRHDSVESAVRAAWRDASEGDVVLLSPGCASFDQFKSFEDRGEQFRSIVESIVKER